MQVMARFTNQFELQDPLEFNAPGVFDLWPRQFAWEARQLINGRTRSDLTRIAKAIEQVIEARAAQEIAEGASTLVQAWGQNPKRSKIMRPRAGTAEGIAAVRSTDGDLNLYRDGGGLQALQRIEECRGLEVREWEAYATIALWKLIDVRANLSAVTSRRMGLRRSTLPIVATDAATAAPSETTLMLRAASDLAEAGCACTLASESKLRHESLALARVSPEMLARLSELEAQQAARGRQARQAAKTAAAHRWTSLDAHKAEALELVSERAFRSRAAAARYAADRISKDDKGNSYTPETVNSWLKAVDWKPKK